jgi:hypothetical protein
MVFCLCTKSQKVYNLFHVEIVVSFVTKLFISLGSDRKRADSFYLWQVPIEKIDDVALSNIFFSWANLRDRIQEEQIKIKMLLDKIKQGMPESISEEEGNNFAKWKKGSDRLEHALLNLDSLIVVFTEGRSSS